MFAYKSRWAGLQKDSLNKKAPCNAPLHCDDLLQSLLKKRQDSPTAQAYLPSRNWGVPIEHPNCVPACPMEHEDFQSEHLTLMASMAS